MTAADDCPYAPKHLANQTTGVCRHCQHEVPEPWFMRRRPAPSDMAASIAWEHGVLLPKHVAQRIAAALLHYGDTAVQVSTVVSREEWDDPQGQADIRQSLRRELLDQVVAEGRIPVALPSEALRYLGSVASLAEAEQVPAEVAAAGYPYDRVEVTLAVPLRTSDVNRAAAVRAGVL